MSKKLAELYNESMNAKPTKEMNWQTHKYWRNTFTVPGTEYEFQFPISVGTIDQAVQYLKDQAWEEVYQVIGARIHFEKKASNLASYLADFYDQVEWEKAALKLAFNNEIELKARPQQQALLEMFRPEPSKDCLPY